MPGLRIAAASWVSWYKVVSVLLIASVNGEFDVVISVSVSLSKSGVDKADHREKDVWVGYSGGAVPSLALLPPPESMSSFPSFSSSPKNSVTKIQLCWIILSLPSSLHSSTKLLTSSKG